MILEFTFHSTFFWVIFLSALWFLIVTCYPYKPKYKQTNYMIGLCYAESMYHKLVSENDHKYAISVLSQPVYHMTNVDWLEGYRDYVMNVKERNDV